MKSPFPRRVFLALLLLMVGPIAAHGEDPPSDELQRRWEERDEEREAHREALAARESERKKELAEKGIVGVETLAEPGDPAGCVDVVFIGDGFTADEMDDYRLVVARMAANYDTPPFDTHAARVNLHRIDLVSNDTGIASGEGAHDTPLGGTVVPFPGGKLLRCNVKKAAELVVAAIPDADYVQVVLNTHGKFLGSANSGAIVLLSTAGGHQKSIVVHEFAHNFAGLLDEYVDPKQSGTRTPDPRLAQVANLSLISNVHLTKWHLWNIPEAIFFGQDRKSAVKIEDNVRCYEGAATFTDGVFRAEENCHMQRGRGKAFCRVCRESLELALFRFFTPIAAIDPLPAGVVMELGQARTFTVKPIDLGREEDTIEVSWYLDGRRLKSRSKPATGPTQTLKSAVLGKGTHHLTAIVDLKTPRVRVDRGRLSGTVTWTIEVIKEIGPLTTDGKQFVDAGAPCSFVVPKGWIPRNIPDGAEFDEEARTLNWTPGEEHQGAWSLEFGAGPGEGSRTETVLLVVRTPDKKRNRPPKPLFLPAQEETEGEALTFRLEAWDPDGDHLTWTAEDLPPGARLDPNSGEFSWEVRHFQRGRYEIECEATDGGKRVKTTAVITIHGRPRFRGIFRVDPGDVPDYSRPSDRMLVGLHHFLPAVRKRSAANRADISRPQLLAESLRLLRETAPGLSEAAAGVLAETFDQAAASGSTWHLDMFLDQMPGYVWQFVDRPKDLERIRAWCEIAKETEGVSRKVRKNIDALIADIDRIEQYNRDRCEWPAPAPITDKKFR